MTKGGEEGLDRVGRIGRGNDRSEVVEMRFMMVKAVWYFAVDSQHMRCSRPRRILLMSD